MMKSKVLILASVVSIALGLFFLADAYVQSKKVGLSDMIASGDVEYEKGNFDGALRIYLKAKEMAGEYKPLLNLKISNTYFQMGEEQFGKTVTSSKYGLSSFDTNTDAAHSYYDKALTALDEFDPETLPANLRWRYHYNRGNLLLRKTILSNANPRAKGKKETMRLYKEAMESYKWALNLRPAVATDGDETQELYAKQNLEYILNRRFLERSKIGRVIKKIKMEMNSMNRSTDRKSKLKMLVPEVKKVTKRGGTTGMGGETGLK